MILAGRGSAEAGIAKYRGPEHRRECAMWRTNHRDAVRSRLLMRMAACAPICSRWRTGRREERGRGGPFRLVFSKGKKFGYAKISDVVSNSIDTTPKALLREFS